MDRHERYEENHGVSIVRRLGSTPRERGSQQGMNCPDIFLLSDGTIGYIGKDCTDEYRDRLPDGGSIGSDERLVVLPLRALLDAIPDILKG